MGTFSASDAPDLDRIARQVKNALVDLRNSVDSGAEDTKSNIQAFLAGYEDNVAAPRAMAAAADRQRIGLLARSTAQFRHCFQASLNHAAQPCVGAPSGDIACRRTLISSRAFTRDEAMSGRRACRRSPLRSRLY